MNLVNHIGLTVSNLENSAAFYQNVVGFEFKRRGYKTGGEWFDTLTENEGAVIDAVILHSGNVVLQLVEYLEGGIGESMTGHSRVGNLHLCINTSDVEAKHREIAALGSIPFTDIVQLPTPGVRSFYVRDPDGTPVEFLEVNNAGS